jgi:hypothetical protein
MSHIVYFLSQNTSCSQLYHPIYILQGKRGVKTKGSRNQALRLETLEDFLEELDSLKNAI